MMFDDCSACGDRATFEISSKDVALEESTLCEDCFRGALLDQVLFLGENSGPLVISYRGTLDGVTRFAFQSMSDFRIAEAKREEQQRETS